MCLTISQGTEDLNTVAFRLHKIIKVYKIPNPKVFNLPIKTVPKGEIVILYNELVDSYIRINYKGIEGWVNYNKLNVSDELKNKLFKQKITLAEESKSEEVPSNVKQIKAVEKQSEKSIKKELKPSQIETPIMPKTVAPPEPIQKDDSKSSVINQSDESNVSNGFINGYFIVTLLVALSLTGLLIKTFIENRRLNKIYKPIIDIDKAVKERKIEVHQEEKKIAGIKNDYLEKKKMYDSLVEEVQILTDDLDYMAHGLYEPRFDLDTSEAFKDLIKRIRKQQKQLIKDKKAVEVHTTWEVSGSKVEGRKMTTRLTRIALRAFNGECDSIISKVSWNNVDKMEQRIDRSFEAINKMLEPMNMEISWNYNDLKDKELYATHEYREKKYEEKEEIRRIRSEEREERKVLMEAEKARKEAEKKQKLYEEALAIAREELGLLSEEELEEKNKQIEELEEKLQEALKEKERAIAQAQLTKTGHVYVISNIGSFGEDVYKIGLTRRLEPGERIRELGDASVPFPFDIHAMIFSEDAPFLEHNLHEVFEAKRVNLANRRKEFYKVTLDDIEKEVKEINPDAEFYYTAESKEYKQTLALLKTKEEQLEELREQKSKFPDSI